MEYGKGYSSKYLASFTLTAEHNLWQERTHSLTPSPQTQSRRLWPREEPDRRQVWPGGRKRCLATVTEWLDTPRDEPGKHRSTERGSGEAVDSLSKQHSVSVRGGCLRSQSIRFVSWQLKCAIIWPCDDMKVCCQQFLSGSVCQIKQAKKSLWCMKAISCNVGRLYCQTTLAVAGSLCGTVYWMSERLTSGQ